MKMVGATSSDSFSSYGLNGHKLRNFTPKFLC